MSSLGGEQCSGPRGHPGNTSQVGLEKMININSNYHLARASSSGGCGWACGKQPREKRTAATHLQLMVAMWEDGLSTARSESQKSGFPMQAPSFSTLGIKFVFKILCSSNYTYLQDKSTLLNHQLAAFGSRL